MIGMTTPTSTASTLRRLFLAALAIRWTYSLVLFACMGETGFLGGADSYTFLEYPRFFAAAAASGTIGGLDWLGMQPYIMPLFLWLVASQALLFGTFGALTYVLLQGLLDAGTCLVVHGIANHFSPRYAVPAAVAATINPTQIVMSGMIYSDTPFVLFVALFLFATVRWLKEPSWRWAILIGVALGAASLTRVLVTPWAAAMLAYLLIVLVLQRRLSARNAAQLVGAAAIVGLCIAPVLARNVIQFGAWSLTPQGGWHLASFVVPLVKEARDGTPWQLGYDEMERRMLLRFGNPDDNPFEESRRYTELGREALAELGLVAVGKAWLRGAAINVAAPGIILSPPLYHLPRTGFYATVGTSFSEKVIKFLLYSDNAAYAWALLLGLLGVGVVRLIQLSGLVAMIIRREISLPVLGLLGGWFVFILLANGPIASPKYRLPLEPLLTVLTGAGYRACADWRNRRHRRDDG
jgi:4-amino-4-deoxy-L-arabinose transferase-like glycosyltransferase